jgi:hypothetical protein
MARRILPTRAHEILTRCNAFQDFHALSRQSVDALLEEADAYRYRKSKNANGSRARCFHEYLFRALRSPSGEVEEARRKGKLITIIQNGHTYNPKETT